MAGVMYRRPMDWVGTAPPMAGLLRLVCAIPPHRTGHATFTASSSPSDGLNQGRERRLFRHQRRVHTSLLWHSSPRSTPFLTARLRHVDGFPALELLRGLCHPSSIGRSWPAPSPESRTSFPSSHRLRLHVALGPASTSGLALCHARHRRMPGHRECGHPGPDRAISANGRQRPR